MAESTKNITYEKLFEILRSEKSNQSLQKLSDAFFEDVQLYMENKLAILKKNKDSDNVFAEKEMEEASKQLANTKKIIKMIYDLREKKIVTMALNKSRTSSSLINTSGLHMQETAFFKDMVELLDTYRKKHLSVLLDGVPRSKPAPQQKQEASKLVRFLDDVEEFVDSDTTYGPFREEDIASLPNDIADRLVKKNKVQCLNT